VTVSPSVLLVSIAIGIPLMLLALGVLYHAYLLSHSPTDLESHVEQLVTDPDEVMRDLQRSMNDIRGELTRQRASLRGMLSDLPATAAATAAAAPTMAPRTASMASNTAPVAAPAADAPSSNITASSATPAPTISPAPAAMPEPAPAMPPAPAPMPAPAPVLPIDRTAGELRAAVHDLAAEGLSDRSIARRLRIGLEEVRLARASGGGSKRPA